MLDISKAIRVEKFNRYKAGPRYTYIFNCLNCNKEVRVRSDALRTHSCKCQSCSHQKRPYESIYNSLLNDHRKIEITLTYDEFLELTKITNCYYCNSIIKREEYGTKNGKFITRSYLLDRKDNNKGYTKDNCVSCCWKCNRMKLSMNDNEYIEHCKKVALQNGICEL